MESTQKMSDWKETQYGFIVRETMHWHMTGDTIRLLNRLNIRNYPVQEKVWLEELSKEAGLLFFTGHGTDGPVSGYRVYQIEEKLLEAYRLTKEVVRMKTALDDCQAELLQEKEYVRILTELVQKLETSGSSETEASEANEDVFEVVDVD
jgi:hypothetical protein